MRNYKVKPIAALSRGLDVLQALQEMRAASLHDLHKVTGIPKSTLTRILFTLYGQGLVWQRLADGAFLPSHTLHQRTRLDDGDWLVEITSPVLEQLCEKVRWPSILSVPRLDYMEVLETNSPRAYFDEVPARPINFRANMLRSASGRAYLAFCPRPNARPCLPACGNGTCQDTNWPMTPTRCTGSSRRRGGAGTASATPTSAATTPRRASRWTTAGTRSPCRSG